MKPNSCTREADVIAALRNDALPHDLRAHLSVCEVCSEVMQVTHALLREVAPVSAELRPPHASVVWRRVQSLAREKAIAKATQPIRIARIGSLVAAAIALPWLVLTLPNSHWRISDLASHLRTLDVSFSSAATAAFLLGTVGSLFLIILSSWYVLRQQ
jgi:hypothetical protein